MTTIAQQAQELAAMASNLHRQPISRKSVDAAIAATKPVAVMKTPDVGPPHKAGCDCAACMRHAKDASAAKEFGKGVGHGAVHAAAELMSDDEEEEFIEEEIHSGIHEEVKVAEGDGVGSMVSAVKSATQTGAHMGAAVAEGKVPGVNDEPAHPGFKAVASKIAKEEGVSKESANKILGAHNAKMGIK